MLSKFDKIKIIASHIDRKGYVIIGVAMVFIIVQAFLEIQIPGYMMDIVSILYSPEGTVSEIVAPGSTMILCALGSLVASLIGGLLVAKTAASISMRLRASVFSKTLDFSMEEMGGFTPASLITRATNDITQVQMFIAMGMQVIVKAPVMAIFALSKIIGKGTDWTIATVLAVLILMMIMSVIVFVAIPKTRKIQSLTDGVNKITRENLVGMRVVRAYNAEPYQKEKFEAANNELTNTQLFVGRVMSLVAPSMAFLMSGLAAMIYLIGAFMIDLADLVDDRLNIFAETLVFSNYAMLVVMAFTALSIITIIAPRFLVAANRIIDVITVEPKIKDGNVTDYNEEGVEFKDVTFTYPGGKAPAVSGISFSVKKGETVALIGATGCGKTTIVNLIPRFYDVDSGQITIDGVDVRDYKLKELRNKIGFTPQKASLFSGTVSYNVSYGKDATSKDIEDAISISQSKEFVDSLDGGNEAWISRGGNNLSGGQRQRLSIARAICCKPPICVFDDSFSALDYSTDLKLRKALASEMKDSAVIVVAQRIGTVKDADRILVIDDGIIVGSGKHTDLLETCSVYKDIALSQLSEEELSCPLGQ